MKTITRVMTLALTGVLLIASGALALTANHSYTVQLSTVSSRGQQTAVQQMDVMADADGKLAFQFSDIPDTDTAPYLMVEIMDIVGGQQQVVRQSLMPAPTTGQQLQMGVNQQSSRQTRTALQAMQAGADQTFGAMFPLLMIPTGAISADDAASFGQAAADAASTFHDYLSSHGVSASQMADFRDGLQAAMRDYAAAQKSVAEQTDAATAAGLCGQAGARLMATLLQAGDAAGIDPTLMSTAFDQAEQSIDASTALNTVSTEAIEAMHTGLLVDAQQRQLMAQLRGYASAMPVVGADSTQTQTFTMAMTSLQTAMLQARQDVFQQAFADPDNLPASTSIDQALTSMQTAMQNAFTAFDQATTTSDTQIADMLGTMAGGMNGSGGMMGGGMMSGSTLSGMGFGMLQTSLGGTSRNWSMMMLAATNLLATVPDLNYIPATDQLIAQLAAENQPTVPDWSLLADGPEKSLLQLQYDLMLVHLIDLQTLADLTLPLSQDDLAALSAQNLANQTLVRQGLEGVSDTQIDALLAALSRPWLCTVY